MTMSRRKKRIIKTGMAVSALLILAGIIFGISKLFANDEQDSSGLGDETIEVRSLEMADTAVAEQGEVAQEVQALLNQYQGQPVRVYYQSLEDGSYAELNADDMVYGASAPKVILVAYTQELVARGDLSWDDTFTYTPEVHDYPQSFGSIGSGTLQNEDLTNGSFTLLDITQRTMENSDNIGADMLLHYVAYPNKDDFDQFVQNVYGVSEYNVYITARELAQATLYLYGQEERQGMLAMDQTDYDGTKLDVAQGNVFQKIGAYWPYYNHTTGFVIGEKPYLLTILTDYWSDAEIEVLVSEIDDIVVNGATAEEAAVDGEEASSENQPAASGTSEGNQGSNANDQDPSTTPAVQ
ncbi:serine hydrolase [Aerococcus kribbianus]|uniref:Serine hydrolase n=1 Tax=Aerococcus kribbianus TaxID=2999064 RepID=A0A9X3JGE5_9LACT|nr:MULTISPECIES: serine hydrolase [unclassified Aerococcus]MCZ0717156.1 serine hydrolase [Aerococcus sp. YH-aer221]MCZ0725444.1 serine hydrolase [Aerococcus sp. YH-aer222]